MSEARSPFENLPSSSHAQVAPESYEAALTELETLVARIDAGELPLDQLLVNYQRGAFLLQFCREQLTAVETQIKLLDEGQLTPWEGA